MEQEIREKISILVQNAQGGDLQAKEELYKLMVNKVYYLALKIVKNEQDAMDIMQESFIKAFNKLDTLTDTMAFTTWLYRITANNSKNLLTRGKKEIFSIDSDDDNDDAKEISDLDEEFLPQSAVDNKETQRLVKKIIDDLPDVQRSCIMMYYFGEMSVKEIAETLDCSEGTVKSRLNYGRKQIKEAVLTLEEREGTKLYNIAPFGLLVIIISSISNEECLAAELTQQLWKDISNDVNMEIKGKGTAKEAGTVATKAGAVVSGKIIIGVIVAAVAIGAIAISNNKNKVENVDNITTAEKSIEEGDETEKSGQILAETDQAIVFKDPVIEKCLREIIGKTEGDVYVNDFDDIKSIKFLDKYMGTYVKGSEYAYSSSVGLAKKIDNTEEEYSNEYGKYSDKFNVASEGNDAFMKKINYYRSEGFTTLEDLKFLRHLEIISFYNIDNLNEKMDGFSNDTVHSIFITSDVDSYVIPDLSGFSFLHILGIYNSDPKARYVDITGKMDFSNIAKLNNINNNGGLQLSIWVQNIDNINFVAPLNLGSLDIMSSGKETLSIDANIFKNMTNLWQLAIYNEYNSNGMAKSNTIVSNAGVLDNLPNVSSYDIDIR